MLCWLLLSFGKTEIRYIQSTWLSAVTSWSFASSIHDRMRMRPHVDVVVVVVVVTLFDLNLLSTNLSRP